MWVPAASLCLANAGFDHFAHRWQSLPFASTKVGSSKQEVSHGALAGSTLQISTFFSCMALISRDAGIARTAAIITIPMNLDEGPTCLPNQSGPIRAKRPSLGALDVFGWRPLC